MNFIQSVKTCFRKYADFKGRATRSEFWWFQLFAVALAFGAETLDALIFGYNSNSLITPLALSVDALTILPVTAVTARRFHDIGWSGWWQLPLLGLYLVYLEVVFPGLTETWLFLWIIVVIGIYALWYLFMMIKDSQPFTNVYGPNPKSPDMGEVFS